MNKGVISKVARIVYLVFIWLLFLLPKVLLGIIKFIEGFFRVLRKTLDAFVKEGKEEMMSFK